MQNDRYAGRQVGTCVWCSSDYEMAYSRARDNGHFCTKKCEVEARFWLHDKLKVTAKPADDAPTSSE